MQKLESLESIYLALAFFAPGLIATFVRAQFTTGRIPSITDAALGYLCLSIVYYALALPFLDFLLTDRVLNLRTVSSWFFIVFIGPAIFGFLLGINTKKEYLRRLLRAAGINPVHSVPAAWDWKFGRMEESWVLVVLKDGTKFAGLSGSSSFMSSDPNERDFYLQQIYEIAPDKTWHATESSLLICSGEIRTIEFWPYRSKEN